jgi:hypothetical protein
MLYPSFGADAVALLEFRQLYRRTLGTGSNYLTYWDATTGVAKTGDFSLKAECFSPP